ncbi:hypothetical protein [Nocardia suismassiliense]|uniref:hypothetical protein n=1 Tax=Nocardia suismassiliense TaxID=2077092 RepID=UPI000D1DA5A4|nr:hypothetical protein [Nocardia suismassiliense]
MESTRTKIAGPAIAAGAISVGLVLIGACGIGKQDTYVAPPPLQSDPNVAPVVHSGTSVTVPKVSIPPSPTWRIAPYQAPQATPFTGFATTTSGEPAPEESHGIPPHETPSEDTRPPATTTEAPTTEAPTTRPTTTRPTRPRPTTTTPDEPTTRPSESPSGGLNSDHE